MFVLMIDCKWIQSRFCSSLFRHDASRHRKTSCDGYRRLNYNSRIVYYSVTTWKPQQLAPNNVGEAIPRLEIDDVHLCVEYTS